MTPETRRLCAECGKHIDWQDGPYANGNGGPWHRRCIPYGFTGDLPARADAPPIKLPTQLAPKRNLRRLSEEEKVSLLIRAQEEIAAGKPDGIRLATRLVEEVIEAIRT